MIARKLLEDMFKDCKDIDSFDIKSECLWSYFFTDPDPDKLLAAGETLAKRGFNLVGILEAGGSPDESEEQYYYLQVDRVECHSVDTLMKRNEELESFAQERELHSYDGMEVGAVNGEDSNGTR
jgi:hypothetical protein